MTYNLSRFRHSHQRQNPLFCNPGSQLFFIVKKVFCIGIMICIINQIDDSRHICLRSQTNSKRFLFLMFIIAVRSINLFQPLIILDMETNSQFPTILSHVSVTKLITKTANHRKRKSISCFRCLIRVKNWNITGIHRTAMIRKHQQQALFLFFTTQMEFIIQTYFGNPIQDKNKGLFTYQA